MHLDPSMTLGDVGALGGALDVEVHQNGRSGELLTQDSVSDGHASGAGRVGRSCTAPSPWTMDEASQVVVG